MSIAACSLGCSSGSFAGQISCSISDVYVNQEIRVTFNGPIDLSSVTNSSFSVVQEGGATPPGSFSLDPTNKRVLIYRPLLTFDSSGNPSFGLKDQATYTIRMPGTNNSSGPYVLSELGAPNQTTLECVVVASRGVFDVKTGSPTVSVFVDTIAPGGGVNEMRNVEDPLEVNPNQPVVSRKTAITMEFDDIMNPATLVNPVTGVASNVTVKVDADGNIADTSDQVTVPGRFSIALDQSRLTTTVVFTPDGDFPSSGNDTLHQRRIVVTLPSTILDLGDNSIQSPRTISFTPEEVIFPPTVLTEGFENTINEDAGRSGNEWATAGALLPGAGGGGSGRLGEMTIPAGKTVVLSTDPMDGEDLSGIGDPAIFNPLNALEQTTFGEIDPITDGIFEFNRLRIDAGAALRFIGPIPPRIYVRGEAVIQGVVDVAGKPAETHDSEELDGGVGGEAGPGGGTGGDGGDRSDGSAFLLEDGVENPNMPMLYEDIDGKDGGGIPEPNTLMPNSLVGGGAGGLAWPQPTVDFPTFHFPEDITDVSGMQFEKKQFCRNRIPGGAGAGGGHAFDGKQGVASLVPITGIGNDPADPPPNSAGGDVTALMIDDEVKTLDPELGLLRGGGGGGGGGGHLQESAVNGQLLVDCTMPVAGTLVIVEYRHHSSAGGGGGGGGVQIQTGRRMVVDGIVDASGGDGGANLTGRRAQAGGAGAGGSVLLQSPMLTLKEVPGRVDVSGGTGGIGVNNSRAGDASPGFVRLETLGTAPDAAEEAAQIAPTEAEIEDDFGGVLGDVLTTGVWTPNPTPGLGRDNFSGAQSCWLRPDVADPDSFIFELEFFEDGDAPTADGRGWDMLLRVDGFANPQSFRGPNDLFGTPIDDPMNWGNELGGSPVVVRFQGARALGPLPDPCNTLLAGTSSQIFPGSLSGWVDHPAELNDFFGDDPVLQPNIFRFQVIFDASDPNFAAIDGIDEITIPTQPD